jgi:DnaK suppressor protein
MTPSVLEQKRRKGIMLPLQDFRAKLLAQRRDLFHQAAQTEEDLLWLETDVEPEAMERGRTETMVRLLDRLDEREKLEIEAIDLALTRIESGSYGRCQGCGKDIPVARLQAVPTATTCLACGEACEALKK